MSDSALPSQSQQSRPSHLQTWLLAARPKTLPAAAGPVVVGTAAAFGDDVFRFGPALAALLGALLIQIGTNFANDVFDYQRGADTRERLGPVRVTQAGLISPGQVLAGMWTTFGLATLVGIYLAWVAGWPIIVVGLLSIAAAIAYSGGPFPYGYKGMGDVFVFVFFGLVAVGGTYYVQARALSTVAIWAAIPIGLLATAILVVNNLRDINTDRAAGKLTLAVRLGVKGARLEYLLLLTGAFATPPAMWLFGVASPWVMLTWLTLWPATRQVRTVLHESGPPLNLALEGTARLELTYALLLSLGFVLSG